MKKNKGMMIKQMMNKEKDVYLLLNKDLAHRLETRVIRSKNKVTMNKEANEHLILALAVTNKDLVHHHSETKDQTKA
jgi:hypothetical protein